MNMQERASLRNRHIQITFTMPLTLIEIVDKYADSIGMRTNQVVKDLIREGLRTKAREAGQRAPVDRRARVK